MASSQKTPEEREGNKGLLTELYVQLREFQKGSNSGTEADRVRAHPGGPGRRNCGFVATVGFVGYTIGLQLNEPRVPSLVGSVSATFKLSLHRPFRSSRGAVGKWIRRQKF